MPDDNKNEPDSDIDKMSFTCVLSQLALAVASTSILISTIDKSYLKDEIEDFENTHISIDFQNVAERKLAMKFCDDNYDAIVLLPYLSAECGKLTR